MGFVFFILIFVFSILWGIIKALVSEYIRIYLFWSFLIWVLVSLIVLILWKTYKSIYKTYWYIILFFASIVYFLSYFLFSYYQFTNSEKFDNFSTELLSQEIIKKETLFIKNIVNSYSTKEIVNSQEYRDLIKNYSDVNITKVSSYYVKFLMKIKSRIWEENYFDYLTQFNLALKMKQSLDNEDSSSLNELLAKYYDYLYQNTNNNNYLYLKVSVNNWKFDHQIFLNTFYWEQSFYWHNVFWFAKYLLGNPVDAKLYKNYFRIDVSTILILEFLEIILYLLWLMTIIRFSYLKLVIKVDKRYDQFLEFRTNDPLDKISINFNIFRNVSYYSDWEKFNYIIRLFLSKENPQDPTDLSAKLMFYQNNNKMSLLLEKVLPLESTNYTLLLNKLWIESRLPQVETNPKKDDEFKIQWF